MSSRYTTTIADLRAAPRTWLVTGAAGFIGSNLLERLLSLDQVVVGLDNLSTGRRSNLTEVESLVGPNRWARFRFIEGDIREPEACRAACEGADYVLHEAALGSVPRSLDDPVATNASNVSGFLNMLIAARDARVGRFVYAASSSTYGDHPALPKIEERIGRPLSPYAVSKYVNELYADVFARCYGVPVVGLRYFNVFGPRQNPEGAYAAAIPRWVSAMLRGEPVYIYGTGETSRDFCYVENVVQANVLAATVTPPEAIGEVYNIAVGTATTLSRLFELIREELASVHPHVRDLRAVHRDFRAGDVLHSLADISKAMRLLGYEPTHSLQRGLRDSVPWFERHAGS